MLRIGLVEGSAALAEMLRTELELSGNSVILYEDGQQASNAILEACWQNTPLSIDILVLDQDAANMLKRLRLFISSEELPALLLIGNSSMENILSEELDIQTLGKPVTPTSLLKAIKEY